MSNIKNLINLVKLRYEFTAGDEISYYETISFQKEPVSIYIEAILDQTTEWGFITLLDTNSYTEEEIEYRYGKITNGILTNWLDKTVVDITYSGGWSRGDWRIKVK